MPRNRFDAFGSLEVEHVQDHIFSVEGKAAVVFESPTGHLPIGAHIVDLRGDFHLVVPTRKKLVEEYFVDVPADSFSTMFFFEATKVPSV